MDKVCIVRVAIAKEGKLVGLAYTYTHKAVREFSRVQHAALFVWPTDLITLTDLLHKLWPILGDIGSCLVDHLAQIGRWVNDTHHFVSCLCGWVTGSAAPHSHN